MAVPRTRPHEGPPLFSYGFRPFFLFGALYAGAVVTYSVPLLAGSIESASLFAPVDWHVHEMLFGYVAAIIAGFLLTAIPNWTGRLPLHGSALVLLVAIWVAGRLAVFFSAKLGLVISAFVDCAFLAAMVGAAAREIIAGRNWRNLKVVLPIAVLLAANVAFHVEAAANGTTDVARRLALAATITLICIIGGRIVPSFTRNWLAKRPSGPMPTPLSRFDVFSLGLTVLALACWVIAPDLQMTGIALLAAAGANLFRLLRWRGWRTFAEPLVFILHLGFLWIPSGLAIAGLAALFPGLITSAAPVHAFGVGAIGTMTLAVMVRATLGHTGRSLVAGPPAVIVFIAITIAALARVIHATLLPTSWLLHLSATAWAAAFLGFALLFGRALLSSRMK